MSNIKSRLLSFSRGGRAVLACALAFVVALGALALPTTAYADDVTYITIYDATGLNDFATKVNNGQYDDKSSSTLIVSVVKDVDMTNATFDSIGTQEHPFKGTFKARDANNNDYTISNLEESLFGYIASGSVVQFVKASTDSSGINVTSASGTQGVIAAHNAGTINNCTVSNASFNVDNNQAAGAIAGENTGTISNCKVESADIEGLTGTTLGGIAGTNAGNGFISACTVNKTGVKASSSAMVGGMSARIRPQSRTPR